jgi:hypothetical protein
MDDKAAQKQFELGNKRHRGLHSQNTENDGIFWQGPQGWWAFAQNRLFRQLQPSQTAAPKELQPNKNSSGRPTKLVTSSVDSLGHDPADISFLTRMGVFLCSSAVIYVILFVGMAAGLTYGTMNQLIFFSNINWDEQITVAFVGTSYLFVNDIPRLLEAMSAGQVIQDSCLRSGGSLVSSVVAVIDSIAVFALHDSGDIRSIPLSHTVFLVHYRPLDLDRTDRPRYCYPAMACTIVGRPMKHL